MADAVGTVIQSPETGPEAPVKEAAAPVVPDKFKNADGTVNTAALLASYQELEKKQGAPAPKAGDPPATDDKAKAEALKTEAKTEVEANVDTVLKAAGLDLGVFNGEYAKDGKLSDDSYKALEAKGYSKATVDQFIRGQEAINADATAALADIKSVAGGDEGYTNLTAWASQTLKPTEIAEFNEAVSSNKPGIVKAAVQALKAKFDATEGTDPKLLGGNFKSSTDSFRSYAEVTKAMSDPRYGKDPAYTKDIEQKVLRSNIR